jgi:wobble nucleotide-excising tRNase
LPGVGEALKREIAGLASNGESWVAEGMAHAVAISEETVSDSCPFCAQDLDGSALIEHYQAYFSTAYKDLKASIRETGIGVRDTHGGDIPAAFERSIRTAVQTHEFWKDFAELPEIAVDTAAISREWTAAREAALQALRDKATSPLEATILSPDAVGAIQTYRRRIEEIAQLSDRLFGCNGAIDVVREQAAADDIAALQNDLAKLNARKARFEAAIVVLCKEYTDEKSAKAITEGHREVGRAALDHYRQQISPAYETAINDFLSRFNASFRLGKMKSVNNRAGSSASYCVVINQQDVNVTASEGASFNNTLSAGDRNTLALAFFFASMDQDPSLAQKIVVIDDPMTSLDEHRTLRTRQEMRELYSKVEQMIVLSHSNTPQQWTARSLRMLSSNKCHNSCAGHRPRLLSLFGMQ